MKITLNWLGEYVDLAGLTAEKVATDLTNAGIPVEWMQPLSGQVSDVVVGHVLAVEAHPNADRLRVCTVDVAKGDLLTIVCGAKNVAPEQKVPVAVDGAMLPDGKIKRSKLRGVESQGMICSASELGLDAKLLPKEQTQGIFVLPQDAPVGVSIVSYLGLDDMVMELELTPNRSDCLSLRGVAYEVAALYDRSVHMPDAIVKEPSGIGKLPLSVEVATERCSLYTAQVVSDLKLAASPLWMQMRLLAVGTRPINNLVDITNYVMYEWGQPLHAFDYDAIVDHTIVVRQAHATEKVTTLDGELREVPSSSILIADLHKALGLAGVMGGLNSEVTEHTRAVVIESAVFDPVTTRQTARQLALRSEASLRFEKGIDEDVTFQALARAAGLMETFAKGKVASGCIAKGTTISEQRQVKQVVVFVKHIQNLLGYAITQSEMLAVCKRLGFTVRIVSDEEFHVFVPSRRQDITIEADMAEEFARLVGYERIPVSVMRGQLTAGVLKPAQHLKRTLRNFLLDRGLHEVWTYSLTAPKVLDNVLIGEGHPAQKMGMLLNPLSEDRVGLRTLVLPSLLEVAEYNSNRGQKNIRIFEFATVFLPKQVPMLDQPVEVPHITGLLCGNAEPDGPHGDNRMIDFYDVSGLVHAVLREAGVAHGQISFARSKEPYYQVGQCAEIYSKNILVGSFGKINARVTERYDLQESFYFDLDFSVVQKLITSDLRVKELPKTPGAERDLALVVDRDLPVQQLLDAVNSSAGRELENVSVFDVYTGDKVGADRKSVALHLVFRADDRTLTDLEIAARVDTVLLLVKEKFGAHLRF